METKSTDALLDQFEAGKISRRELVAGIGATAVGAAIASLIGGGTVQAQSAQQLDRARVLLSRLANLRVTIEDDGELKPDKTYPLVFEEGPDHQAWLFGPNYGLLTGSKNLAGERVDEDIPADAVPSQHPGVQGGSTGFSEAEPIAYTGTHSKTLHLMKTKTGDNMPWISKVFDLKMAICEVEGMFHMGKEVHEWAKEHCEDCADELYEFIIDKLYDYYTAYFKDANRDDVIKKFTDTPFHDDDGTVNSHEW
jgi:hypothetical protein